jgi:hypothetical protein
MLGIGGFVCKQSQHTVTSSNLANFEGECMSGVYCSIHLSKF